MDAKVFAAGAGIKYRILLVTARLYFKKKTKLNRNVSVGFSGMFRYEEILQMSGGRIVSYLVLQYS